MREETLQLTPQKYTGSQRDYYEHKLNNLEKMDKFLETCNLPRLNYKEPENVNRPITHKEIESVIKNFSTKKSPGPDGFPGEFCQIFKEELNQSFLNSFQKSKRWHTLRPILQCQNYPDTKARYGHYKKSKLQAKIPDAYTCKNSQ